MALNEATLTLILYCKVKNIEYVIIVRTTSHISCFITFLASAIPTPFFILNFFNYSNWVYLYSLSCEFCFGLVSLSVFSNA